ERMNLSSAAFDRLTDEFDVAGLAKIPSCRVRPPRVAASRVQFECRVTQIIQLEAASGERLKSWLTLGEVVTIHIDRSFVSEGIYETAATRPVLRAGGAGWYSEVAEASMFDLRRPSSSGAALDEGAELAVLPSTP
ncbi:flavin reductase family protein, partial [Gluconobacter cerinus]